MKTRSISLIWLASFATAQSSSRAASQSQSVVTLSIPRSGIISDYLPPITLGSNIVGSTIATISRSPVSSSTRSANTTITRTTSTANPLTELGGGNRTVASTSTRSAPARPSNTQPCNNYVEFCNRKYSNITEVCAHNSPFTKQNNAARNQAYGVTQQLNDGIRMLQGQAHYMNGTLYYCHTSCDLLNEGTVEDYLKEVTAWVETHPFDVVTILFGNYDWSEKDSNGNSLVTSVDFDAPIRSSGLIDYIYQPPNTVMGVDDWPTLGEMILSQKRVVTFIDYNQDTTSVPYMLWEFYSIWETPFSPTNISFPCTVQRPEGISEDQAKNMMYIANHNLNAEIAIGDISILVPNTATLNQTNAVSGTGSLGLMSNECTGDWGRPPNFLLVDFYDQGSTPGSVFEVAAQANGVTYNRKCCGTTTRSLASSTYRPSVTYLALAIAGAAALAL
ncbi:PLC-like phosphodiesterase [Setomelanomma holmii]|uniref:PLC-like phosphodiesterase n=1 Tax=Setomelanomma holmii TaxID=210430 RepID=A0A9P4LPX7_9PLEO|nr:PLC-like phosphodiesterase [Setomelanomma holmii]